FLLAGMPMPVVFRASTHIIVGYIGAKMIDKNKGYLKTTIYTSVLHGGLEALVVIPFVGFDLFNLLIVTGVGGLIHHLVDGGLAYGILRATNINKDKLKVKNDERVIDMKSSSENLVLKD
ncbi:MAG: hypothetical protein ACRC30_11540, partial [Clostridium sp.]